MTTPLEAMYPNRCYDCLAVCSPDKVLCSSCEDKYRALKSPDPQNPSDRGTLEPEVDAVTGEPVAWDRAEADACEAGTPGCSIHHTLPDSPCQTW